MSFKAQLIVENRIFNLLVVEYEIRKQIDRYNKPVTRPMSAPITLIIESDADSFFPDWAMSLDDYKSGKIVLYRWDTGSKMKELFFVDAKCVSCREVFNADSDEPMEMHITLTARQLTMGSSTVDNKWPISGGLSASDREKLSKKSQEGAASESETKKTTSAPLTEVSPATNLSMVTPAMASSGLANTKQIAESPATKALPAEEVVKSPKTQFGKLRVAYQFYKDKGWPRSKIEGHLSGIDFSKPVELVKLKKQKELYQWQAPGGYQGNYYSEPHFTPSELGINPEGEAGGKLFTKIQTKYEVQNDIVVLRSSASPVMDTWSVPSKPYSTAGGAIQYFTTDTGSIK